DTATGDSEQDKTDENKANELNNDAQQRTLLNRWRGRPPARRRSLCANTLAIPRPIWLNSRESRREEGEIGTRPGPPQGARRLAFSAVTPGSGRNHCGGRLW